MARRHRVHPDALRAELGGQALGHREQRRLGQLVGSHRPLREPHHHRVDHDHGALALRQSGDEQPGQPQGGDHVRVEARADRVQVDLAQFLDRRHRERVVHQRVHPPERARAPPPPGAPRRPASARSVGTASAAPSERGRPPWPRRQAGPRSARRAPRPPLPARWPARWSGRGRGRPRRPRPPCPAASSAQHPFRDRGLAGGDARPPLPGRTPARCRRTAAVPGRSANGTTETSRPVSGREVAGQPLPAELHVARAGARCAPASSPPRGPAR